jgi:hypothetical protein
MKLRTLLLTLLALIVLGLAWLLTACGVSGPGDRVRSGPLATLPTDRVGWNGTLLQFGATIGEVEGPKDGWNAADISQGSHILSLQGPGPDYRFPARLTVGPDNRLVIEVDGRTMVLGTKAGDMAGGDGPIPAFAPEPNDRVSMTIDASALSWPTPFAMNFMTGHAPTKRRGLSYRLTWTKPSGARLEMVWRYEQGYYAADGWGAPSTAETGTGLVSVTLTQGG